MQGRGLAILFFFFFVLQYRLNNLNRVPRKKSRDMLGFIGFVPISL